MGIWHPGLLAIVAMAEGLGSIVVTNCVMLVLLVAHQCVLCCCLKPRCAEYEGVFGYWCLQYCYVLPVVDEPQPSVSSYLHKLCWVDKKIDRVLEMPEVCGVEWPFVVISAIACYLHSSVEAIHCLLSQLVTAMTRNSATQWNLWPPCYAMFTKCYEVLLVIWHFGYHAQLAAWQAKASTPG